MAYTGTTAAILSNYQEAMKTFFLPAVQEQLNHDMILADKIDVNEEDVFGKEAKIDLHYGRSNAVGARADGGALPDADYQKYKQCTVNVKYNYATIALSGPTIAATRDQRGAWAKAVDNEVSGIARDSMKEVNRQLWGCGYGTLARWRSTESATSYTLQKKYYGNSVGGDGFGSTFGAKYLEEMTSAVPVVPSALSGSSGIITVDTTNIAVSAITEGSTYDTITVTDPDVTEAAATFYVRPGSARTTATTSAAGYGRLEMVGIRGIVTDQNLDDIAATDGTNSGLADADPLQGIDVSTYNWWKATVLAHASGRYAGQRALTLDLMQQAFDKVEKKAGVGYGPDMIITTRAIRREYLALCQADRRTVNSMTLDGGWTALDYNGIPLMVDNDAIDGEMYFLTLKDLQIYRMSDYDWMSDSGGGILRVISGYDAYEATLYRYAELGCKRRNSQGVLCDLAYVAD